MKNKPTRGGAREGAGRKPRDVARVAITVRLEPADAAKLKAQCKTRGISQAQWVAGKINEER